MPNSAAPCLPHLDFLIVNDFEIGALAGVATRRADGSTDVAAVGRAIGEALERGAMTWVVAHFPEGAVAGGRDGTRVALGSVAMPANAVAGVNGAGDAFAAGMIYGLHEDWPIVELPAARPRFGGGFDARGLDHRGRRAGRRVPRACRHMGSEADPGRMRRFRGESARPPERDEGQRRKARGSRRWRADATAVWMASTLRSLR